MHQPVPYKLYPSGDHALTVELAETIDLNINQKVLSLFHYFQQQAIAGIKDLIPAYSSLTIVYDTLLLRKNYPFAFQFIKEQVEKAISAPDEKDTAVTRQVEIPVCYAVALGPDLEAIAFQKQLSIEAVIRLHTQPVYHVYMIGFLPGFAYMGTVVENIATPRKATPRLNVAAGSVGIAGTQTGIYPLDAPGGWNIIGQTPLPLFDATKERSVYLQAGDQVKFKPIGLEAFHTLKNNP